ncbi:MAG: hypothetical protein DRI94_09530 [Bacteroidetes bacterium]|nr:MAG: hypothetical protein DRI94_09530 [Bacteroidota bacterium]
MIIKKTSGSPYVKLSAEECCFEIKGNSFSNIINEIYEKILTWIDEEMPKIDCAIDCIFKFNVSNSVTYKNILIMMTKFVKLKEQGQKINIIWYYNKDEEDSLAIGEDIEELFNLPVQFIEFE